MSGQRLVTVSQSNLTIRRLKGQVTSLVSARTLVPCLIYYFTVCLPLFHHFSFLSPILDCSTHSLINFDVLCCLPSVVTQTDYSRCLVHVSLEPFTMCVCACVCVYTESQCCFMYNSQCPNHFGTGLSSGCWNPLCQQTGRLRITWEFPSSGGQLLTRD